MYELLWRFNVFRSRDVIIKRYWTLSVKSRVQENLFAFFSIKNFSLRTRLLTYDYTSYSQVSSVLLRLPPVMCSELHASVSGVYRRDGKVRPSHFIENKPKVSIKEHFSFLKNILLVCICMNRDTNFCLAIFYRWVYFTSCFIVKETKYLKVSQTHSCFPERYSKQ